MREWFEELREATRRMWREYAFAMWSRNARDRVTDAPAYLDGFREGAD